MRQHKRIGSSMAWVRAEVNTRPGQTKMSVAAKVGPHGSLRYGYEIIDRAIRAGLVVARERADKGRCYRLFPA